MLLDAKEFAMVKILLYFAPSRYREWFILKEKDFPVSTPKSVKCGYEKNQSKKCKDKKTSNFCDKWSTLQWNFLGLS